MQPVTFISDVVATLGALGFSVLHVRLDGNVRRMTLLSLRDHNGWPKAVVIAPAETPRGDLLMCYGVPYQTETRECLNCGSFTNVHMRCDGCEAAMCDCCDHGSNDRHFCSNECRQDACDHEEVNPEIIDDVCPSRVYYHEVITCNDCGAHASIARARSSASQGGSHK